MAAKTESGMAGASGGRWRPANARWLWLTALVVGVDQWSKALAVRHLRFAEPHELLPGFSLTLVHNTGAAFSLLRDAGGWQRYFFIALAAGAAAAILLWILRLSPRQRRLAAALALILGGALGNLWDRLTLGYVIDFFHLYYGRWHWPVFNVADSAITAGAGLVILDSWPKKRVE